MTWDSKYRNSTKIRKLKWVFKIWKLKTAIKSSNLDLHHPNSNSLFLAFVNGNYINRLQHSDVCITMDRPTSRTSSSCQNSHAPSSQTSAPNSSRQYQYQLSHIHCSRFSRFLHHSLSLSLLHRFFRILYFPPTLRHGIRS